MTYIMTDKTRYQMTTEERATREKTKAIHQKLRAPLKDWKHGDRRYDLLAWAFARKMPFRRCERQHHQQVLENGTTFEHNMPQPSCIWERLVRAGAIQHDRELPKFAFQEWLRIRDKDVGQAITAWLADPSGAIAPPARNPKNPYQPVAA